MTPQELKNSILQLAIQGKLVPQRPEEGNAEELNQMLLEEKKKLILLGKLSKKGKTKPFLTQEELNDFDLPKSWEWVQLSDVSIIQEGAGIRKWQYRDKGIQILCVTNILEDKIDLSKKELFISNEDYLEKYTHLKLNKGDIVTSCSGGSWGKIALFESDKILMLNTSTLRMRFFSDLADNKYLYYVCKSKFFKNQLEKQLSGMQPNFGYAHYSRIMLPLPPLAEQKRIVAKIEELLPHVKIYETAYNKLQQLNKRFPDDLQKSVLQLAIQGRLVPQCAKEGNAEELYKQIQAEKQKLIKEGKIKKEKLLPPITDDEKPFEIPESWKWVRLVEIVSNLGDGIHGTPQFDDNGSYFFVNGNNLSNGKIIIKADTKKISVIEYEKYKKPLNYDTILISINGTIGNYAFYNGEPIILGKSACYISTIDKICKYYLLYIFKTNFFYDYAVKAATQTTIKNVSLKAMRMLPIPLPPLAEQKRIVAKIEELLPLCNKLKG